MVDKERVQILLTERGWRQADLARALSVSPAAIQQLLSGKTRNSRLTPKIARLFNVDERWINGESDSRFQEVSGSLTPDQLVKELKLRLSGGYVVGSQGDVDFGHTEGSNLYDPVWIIEQVRKFDPDLAKKADDDPTYMYTPPVTTIEAATDAMAPTIKKGDEILISSETRSIREPDAVWFLSYGGLEMIRRVMPLPSGGYRISADNPHSPTFETPASDVEVLGRAFWMGRTLI